MFLQILSVQHESAGWVMDAIRSVFWMLAKGVLILLDGMFAVINDIWKFKFFDNTYVNNIFTAAIIVACTWLVLKALIEIIMHYYINQDDNSSPTRVIKGIIFSITMMYLISPIFNWGYDLSSKMTEYVISASSSSETTQATFEASMSTMILSTFADNSKMEENDKNNFVENWSTIDYNEVINNGLFDSGEYKYSFHTFSIFIVGLVVVVLLFFIGIQVAKRVIELALYKAISPFICTSLVSNRSHTFEVWAKGVIGTFLVTSVQYLCIGILFNVFGSVVSNTSHAMSVVLIVIGALLFIISSPQLISALLNTNTGVLSNMGELHSMAALGTSLIAMSKFSSASDSSITNNNQNSNSNSDSNSENNSSSFSNNTSNLNSKTSSGNNSQSENINSSIPNNNDFSNNLNNIGSEMNSNTSLSERLDAYKNIVSGDFNFVNNDETLYKTSLDWSDQNVLNTKEH